MLKRLIRHPWTLAAGARLLGLYLALVFHTTRWNVLGEAELRAATEHRSGVLGAFWHERLPIMPCAWRLLHRRLPAQAGRRGHVLVSRSRDGRFIGDVVRRFQLEMVYASSSRGGATGMREMLRLLGQGEAVVVTPDGPRGPRRVAKPGVAQLAALSGLPVIPCAARTSRARVIRSWDRMVIPLPFGRGVVVVGAAVVVPRRDPEAALAQIEAALTACCDAADAAVGAA